jgi:hypothetical protein
MARDACKIGGACDMLLSFFSKHLEPCPLSLFLLSSFALTVKGSVIILDCAGHPCFDLIAVAHINLLAVHGSAVFRQCFRKVLHSFIILVR